MRMYDCIQKKKEGLALSDAEITQMIADYTSGKIPDYQMAAFCMAVCFQGMTDAELRALTEAMVHSGETFDLSRLGERSVDKHSTGGVGDKTTLILAPIVAAAGGMVAKVSGRGLGHTGGTIDKLESFSGFSTELSYDTFLKQVETHGLAVISSSASLAPADKKLYALRDVTATVDSIPLIASSIMSKKLAAGAHSIVLDVKCGSGAFMKRAEDAEKLAQTMIAIGNACHRKTAALITNMDIPLGRAVGNILEVQEAAALLQGKGEEDLQTVCIALASQMIALSLNLEAQAAEQRVKTVLENGAAYRKFVEWIVAQGGSETQANDVSLLPKAPIVHPVLSECEGYLTHMNAEKIGLAAAALGAGRTKKEDVIDLSAGIRILKKTGEWVAKGEPLAMLHTSDSDRLDSAEAVYRSALAFGEKKPAASPVIYKILGG